jgi:hypothetical protein
MIMATGALPAIQSGASLDSEYQKEYFDVLKQSLESLQKRQEPNLFNVAGAFLNPGRTGSFGEALGNAASVVGKQQEEQEARAPQIAQMRAALAGQEFEVAKQGKAMQMVAGIMGTDPATAAQTISSGALPAGMMNKFTPEAMLAISQLDPKLGNSIKEAAGMQNETIKNLLTLRGQGIDVSKELAKYGQGFENVLANQGVRSTSQNNANTPPANIPAPLRNNNPGALMKDGKLIAFNSLDEGIRATDVLLQNYGKQGINTIAEIISKWAPPSDNNPTPAYINQVAQTVGVKPTQSLDMSNPMVRNAIATGIFKQENGSSALTGEPAQKTVNPQASLATQQELVKSQGQSDIEVSKSEREKRTTPYVEKHSTLAGYDANTVQMNDLKTRELIDLVKNNKDVVGQLVHQGPMTALLQLAETGVSTPWGSVSAPVTEAINKLNLTPDKQAVARTISQLIYDLNQNVMKAGKSIYGPQISTFDAQQMAKPGFKETDPASFILYLGSKNIVTNKYMGEMAEKQAEYFEKNPNASTSSFFTSPEYKDVVKRFHTTYADLIKHSPYSNKE